MALKLFFCLGKKGNQHLIQTGSAHYAINVADSTCLWCDDFNKMRHILIYENKNGPNYRFFSYHLFSAFSCSAIGRIVILGYNNRLQAEDIAQKKKIVFKVNTVPFVFSIIALFIDICTVCHFDLSFTESIAWGVQESRRIILHSLKQTPLLPSNVVLHSLAYRCTN